MTNKIKKFLYILVHLFPDGRDEIPTFALYYPLLIMQDENEMRLRLIQYIYILQYIFIHLISLSDHIYDALDEK